MAINQNNFIEAPVSIENLQQLVPVTLRKTVSGKLQQVLSNNLGTIIKAKVYDAIEGWTVARRTHINMWARFKPVCLNKVFTNDELNSSEEWKQDSTWWKGSGNCGITFFSSTTEPCMPSGGFSSVKALKEAIDSNMIIWKHEKPDGGDSQPFRITDFIQYKHDALPPLSGLYASDAVMSTGQSMTASVIPNMSEPLSLNLSELGELSVPNAVGLAAKLKNYHFTVAFYDTYNENTLVLMWVHTKTLNELGENDTIQINIPFNDQSDPTVGGYDRIFVENHTYKMYGFLSCGISTGKHTSDTNGTYIPLPYLDMTEGTPFGIGAPPCTMKAIGYSSSAHIETNILGQVVNYSIYTRGTSGITGATAWIARAGDSLKTPVTDVSIPFNITTQVPSTDPYYPGGYNFYFDTETMKPLAAVRLPDNYERIEDYIIVISGNGFTFTSPLRGTIQIEE